MDIEGIHMCVCVKRERERENKGNRQRFFLHLLFSPLRSVNGFIPKASSRVWLQAHSYRKEISGRRERGN
jgi:hypothetical protein